MGNRKRYYPLPKARDGSEGVVEAQQHPIDYSLKIKELNDQLNVVTAQRDLLEVLTKQQPDAELLEALKAAKWKGEPSGNLEKGWVTTSSGQRFTSLGSRKIYGKFLEEHNKQIDYIIARAKQKGGV